MREGRTRTFRFNLLSPGTRISESQLCSGWSDVMANTKAGFPLQPDQANQNGLAASYYAGSEKFQYPANTYR